ncbi:MAG: flagellar hook-associated protein FlgK [Lachnospiraceae bacterium]|nr:flagellar hook-associated protein FlgK [Candidatus Colinaster scatohippi]
MPSQFFGLNIAYTGLLNSNAGLNATANNIANAETEGYSRQTVHSEAADSLRVWTTYGCVGAGVDTLAIERIHDDFYDNKYWDNNTKAGQYSMKNYYMTQIETYFRDDSTIEGFTTVFNEMMDTLQEVKKNPSSSSTKSQFVGFAGNLCEYFRSMASSMEQVQKDVNSEIKLKIDAINSLSSEIATLNKQINVIDLSGGSANELRDKRTLLIDELSAIVSVDITEYDIVDTNDPDRKTGASAYIVRIAGGQTLVDTNDYNTLQCVARTSDEKVNQSDIDGLYDVFWVTNRNTGALGDEFNLYNASLGGELEGLIQMRDGNNAENFKGSIAAVSSKAEKDPEDGHDIREITVKISKDYLKDLDKCTLSDTGGIITLGSREYYYDDWTYNYDAATDEYTYTFEIDETASGFAVPLNYVGREAEVGYSINYQGVPYYQQQLNEWCRIYAEAFNKILLDGYTSDGEPGTLLYTAEYATEPKQYEFTVDYNTKDDDGNRLSETVSVRDDSYYKLTAKNFTILTAVANDANKLATKKDRAAGADEYGTVERLIDMATNKNVASYRGAATQEFLTCVLSDVALNAKNAATFYNNYNNIGESINNQRISVSGVDNDDEAVNLLKYQNAYTLASKMIQTLTEVYDRLILETGV